MRAWSRQLRITVAACLLALGLAASAEAAPILIGSFSWVEAPDLTQTFAVSTTTGLDPWPLALTLNDVLVDYTRDGGTSGQAFFDGDASCTGVKITVGAGDTFQSPGDYVGDCLLFGPLPQDIIEATLIFTYDALLGAVTVGPLGPAFREGEPTFESVGIFFEEAELTPVPEPTTMVLLGSGLAGVMLRRRRLKSRGVNVTAPLE